MGGKCKSLQSDKCWLIFIDLKKGKRRTTHSSTLNHTIKHTYINILL